MMIEIKDTGQETRRGVETLCRICVLSLLILTAAGCRQDVKQRPSGKIVKIGVIGSFSGQDEQVGKSGLLGVQAALALQPLLDNGDKVELLIEDDKSEPGKAIDALESLIDRGAVGVLLLSRSEIALELADDIRWKMTPILASIATHTDLTEKRPYITQISFDDSFQAAVAAMYARDELLLKSVAVISDPDDSHSQLLAESFISKFSDSRGVVQQHIILSDRSMDLQEPLLKLKQEGVELLYMPVRAESLLHVAASLKRMQWRPDVITSDGLLSEILLKHPSERNLINGMMATDMHSALLTKTEYGKAVTKAFRENNMEGGSVFSILGAESASILIEAMNNCGADHESRNVQREIRNIRSFEGFFGTLSIGMNGKVTRPVYINIIRTPNMELLVKVY
jgi:ABC-type branched-subunit amino acid transport system substrate-binding protein